MALVREGKVPKLRALQIHNSTVYRWNRPCYGISPNGQPHLRIENRVIPAGPSVVDEVANAALWLGCMITMGERYEDITKTLDFADARDNFLKAAKFGIDTTFTWLNDSKISAQDLILQELLPMAREGLKARKVQSADINKYLGIIEARAKDHRTGARSALRSYISLVNQVTPDEALAGVTAYMIKNQKDNKPVHTWKEPTAADLEGWNPREIKVEEFMSTDLFTVQKDDPIDLVAEIMNWRRIRYMPVENTKGELVGLISSRMLLRYYARPEKMELEQITTVKDIMVEKPLTAMPETPVVDALKRMRDNNIGCLPVVKGKELVGIITEMDFLRITSRLMDKFDQQQNGKEKS